MVTEIVSAVIVVALVGTALFAGFGGGDDVDMDENFGARTEQTQSVDDNGEEDQIYPLPASFFEDTTPFSFVNDYSDNGGDREQGSVIGGGVSRQVEQREKEKLSIVAPFTSSTTPVVTTSRSTPTTTLTNQFENLLRTEGTGSPAANFKQTRTTIRPPSTSNIQTIPSTAEVNVDNLPPEKYPIDYQKPIFDIINEAYGDASGALGRLNDLYDSDNKPSTTEVLDTSGGLANVYESVAKQIEGATAGGTVEDRQELSGLFRGLSSALRTNNGGAADARRINAASQAIVDRIVGGDTSAGGSGAALAFALLGQLLRPFGGTVSGVFPACVNGTYFDVIRSTEVYPFILKTRVSLLPLFQPPVPAQKALGTIIPIPFACLVPCPAGLCPVLWGFFPIHGSSLK
ncbi:MAG: hypothetical protein OXU73_00365 [Candidatus Campbellbacteria bacterium]|nr:hypothetical protein [Candidatus Campbellbacteria bacterium]